jgi:hypothetical protein
MAQSRRSIAAGYRLEAYATLHSPKAFGAEDHPFVKLGLMGLHPGIVDGAIHDETIIRAEDGTFNGGNLVVERRLADIEGGPAAAAREDSVQPF